MTDRKNWIPWNDVSIARGSKRGSKMGAAVKYYSRPSQCIGAGVNSPTLQHAGAPLEGYQTAQLPDDLRTTLARHWEDIKHKELHVLPRHRHDARIAYKVIIPWPNELTPGQVMDATDGMLSTVLRGEHEYLYTVHRGNEGKRGHDQCHVHLMIRARPISGVKNDARWMTGDKAACAARFGWSDAELAKMKHGGHRKWTAAGASNGKKNGIINNVLGDQLKAAMGEELRKLGYTILPHGARRGGSMRKRLPGVVVGKQKRAQEAIKQNAELQTEYRRLLAEERRIEEELEKLEMSEKAVKTPARAPGRPLPRMRRPRPEVHTGEIHRIATATLQTAEQTARAEKARRRGDDHAPGRSGPNMGCR